MADEGLEAKKRRWSAWLNAQLARTGMSATEVAAATGLPLSTVSNWVQGRVTAGAEHAAVVAEALGASPVDALENAGHPRLAALVRRAAEGSGIQTAQASAPIEASPEYRALPEEVKPEVDQYYEELIERSAADAIALGRRLAKTQRPA